MMGDLFKKRTVTELLEQEFNPLNDHRKIYKITGRAILDIMKKYGDVPNDVEYIDCHYYPTEELFGLKVHSDLFPQTPECSLIPKEDVTIEEKNDG